MIDSEGRSMLRPSLSIISTIHLIADYKLFLVFSLFGDKHSPFLIARFIGFDAKEIGGNKSSNVRRKATIFKALFDHSK
jgi:hypothetical protein